MDTSPRSIPARTPGRCIAISVIFFAVNENENMTNVADTPATCLVLHWYTPLTPKS